MPGLKARSDAGAAMVVNRGMTEPMILTNPMEGRYKEFAEANLKLLVEHGLKPVEHDRFHGKVLALCGAGPSLATGPIYPADEVWGCNSAVTWLAEHGPEPTGTIGIDQTERMLVDWADTPDVTHYVASTVHSKLMADLVRRGRDVRVFHNLVGWGEDEIEFYNSAPWPASFMMGGGATVISRAIGLDRKSVV